MVGLRHVEIALGNMLISSGCHDKVSQTGGRKQQTLIFSQAGGRKSKIMVLLRSHFLHYRWLSFLSFYDFFPSMLVCFLIQSPYKDTSHSALVPPRSITSFYFNTSLKALSPSRVIFWDTRGYDFNIWILGWGRGVEGCNSAYNRKM